MPAPRDAAVSAGAREVYLVEEPVAAEEPAVVEEQAPKKGKKKSAKAKGDKKAKTNAPVSINKASESELAAVKGLPKAVAAAIVAARPLASLDELLKLEALRSSRIQWTTNVDLADALMGLRPVPAPARSGPLQQVREQMAAAGRMPMPAPMPVPTATAAPAAVVIPSIQIPKIQL